jgi:alkylhydroperoxidase family enzyme
VEALKKHYTDAQVLEILVTVAGNNSTTRWTDGLNIPAEADGSRFKKDNAKADFGTFKTPTSEKFAKQQSSVAPLKLPARAPLEARDTVEAIWKVQRTTLLPLADSKSVTVVWGAGAAPNWAALLANFPKAMKGRVNGLRNAMEKGNLSPKLKAQIAWVAARQDRAWYALAVAREQLRAAGVSADDCWKLDGSRTHLTEAEQAALALAEVLTATPWKVTDEMVERCRKSFKDAEVAEIVNCVCNAAFFDRVTEVAGLPFDKPSDK